MYDAVVVGGGPAGSYAAYKLAGMGHDVIVLDKKEKLGEPVCCTGIISKECVDSFAIDNSVILNQVSNIKLFSSTGNLIRFSRQNTQACIVDRGALDKMLAERAQNEGAKYVLNSPVSDMKIENNGVKVKINRQEEELIVEARVVVVAAGFGARLISGLGLGKINDFIMGAQATVETVGIDETEVYFSQERAPGFFAWLVPISPATALVGLALHSSTSFYMRKLLASLLEEGKIASDKIKPCYRAIPLSPLSRTYGQRLVVVGDSAGQVKPTTGGGVYFGLLCADIAASNLHRALESGDLSAKSLSGYEREWKKLIGRELKICYYARKFYERLSDKQIDRIFNIIKSRDLEEVLFKDNDLPFDWHGEIILKLLGYKMLSGAIKAMKIPFRIRRD
ncbi:MAG: NAD(P)/FAD-dependent oxidoreductase [Dehalococcoidales bacterium]|nr:NAD(P)/FAD-dependent oxidoreductase [Dehalococcoidales bacterium]